MGNRESVSDGRKPCENGLADALCSQVYDEYEHSTRINLRAKTYYDVFGLNRQELAVVATKQKVVPRGG